MSSTGKHYASTADVASAIGFPVTICILCYGQNARLASGFLRSLYACTDPELFHLRVGLNETEPETRKLFERAADQWRNVMMFDEPANVFKSPLMRRMFHEVPLESEWVIWCDDDTFFTRRDWLQRLALKIERHPEFSIWGQQYSLLRLDEGILGWIRAAPWYRGIPFMRRMDSAGKEATEFHFVTGGFWAVRTTVLHQLDWPDKRLVQANDDFLLGEAIRQNGLATGYFDYGVRINHAPRRNAGAPQVEHLGY